MSRGDDHDLQSFFLQVDQRRWHRRRVPEISRFFGIIIRMFVEAGEPHHRPHFHAYYQDQTAVYAIDTN